jgi:predicted TIM-barrel fold metal-dependent hydrolase
VFDRWPNLQVLLVGGGACWIPTCMWRCDYQFQLSPGVEAPWMQGMPSSYLVEHFKIATYSLESPPDVRQLHAVLDVIPNVEHMLMYASCYPNSDSEEPEAIAERVPERWHSQVFHDNAMAFFRWPDRPPRDRRAPVVSQADLRDRTIPRRRQAVEQEVGT